MTQVTAHNPNARAARAMAKGGAGGAGRATKRDFAEGEFGEQPS
jgi:hypothetical protein